MTSPSRLALATPATGPDPSPAGLAWLAGLADRQRVQHFRARACPTGSGMIGALAGLPGRHLDAWLMPEELLRSLFARGAAGAELALVEGTLDDAEPLTCGLRERPGPLRPIAEALELPIVAVVPCPPRQSFHLPHVPEEADAVFLDEIEDPADFEFFRRILELTIRKPVLGGLDALPELRRHLLEAPSGDALPPEIVDELARSFRRHADLGAIRDLARRGLVAGTPSRAPRCATTRFRVAYAQDEAFGGYFPDTLEALESLGAELVEFSPLRDETLPGRVDLVMIGCGFPDQHAAALAENISMIASLRGHVCRGRRIYSEGGGTAYLGRALIVGNHAYMGAGILPFDAVLRPDAVPPVPVSRVLIRDCWLGPAGTEVRGYLSGRWRFVPGADPMDCPACHGPLTLEGDAYYHHHAVGGLVHLHLGALPDVVAAFAGPHHASLTLPSARS